MRPVSRQQLFLLAVCAVLALAAAWYARHVDLSRFVTDDGGIYLRYAERIAGGRGFNYNDGERVNGASSTLTTWTFAALLRLGLAPERAIFHFGVACFTATITLLFYTLARHVSWFAAVFALLAYLSTDFLFGYLFDALEPNLVLFFATLLFHALHVRSQAYAGVVLGLLVACKPDGAFAAIAFAGAWLLAYRRFPLRAALVALATAAPAFVVQLVAFGTVLPNSALAKLAMETEGGGFDPTWVGKILLHQLPGFLLVALFSFAIGGDGERGLPRRVIQLWFLLHVVFFSAVDLSAPFPWYCSLPAYLALILSALVVDALLPKPADRAGATSRTSRVIARSACALVLLAAFLAHGLPSVLDRLRRPEAPDRVVDAYAGEIARLASGAWLRKHTSGTELLATGYGLPAYEYKGPVHDLCLLNSLDDPDYVARSKYIVDGPYNGEHVPAATLDDTGFGLIATFRYGPTADLYALFASDDSEARRAGCHHLTHALSTRVPLDARTGAALDASAYDVARRGLSTRIPTDVRFEIECPLPPTVHVAPSVWLPRGSDARVRIRVTVDGAIAHEETLSAGGPPASRFVVARAVEPSGRYRIGLVAEWVDAAAPEGSVVWEDLEAQVGERLDPADFSLMCKPWAQRIRAVERAARPGS